MIEISNVVSVYSGRPGCMCGCRGRHSYADRFARVGGERRGYAVRPEEISDRSVKHVVSKLNADPNTRVEDGIAWLDLATRSYAVYLADQE